MTINESTIRKMVEAALRSAINENIAGEYRTKGSLNKKTLEKMAANPESVKPAASEPKEPEATDYNPDWDDYSYENIKDMYNDDEEEFDDSQAGGDYQIDPRNPYFIDKSGKEVPADAIGQFHNDFAIVKKDGQVNYINSDGVILSDEWFDACNDFESGFGMVSKNMKRNFVGSDGQLLLDTWVDRAGDFVGNTAPVIINGQRYTVDRNGNIS